MKNMKYAKAEVAEAALAYVKSDQLLGVGTGSTVSYLIKAMTLRKVYPSAAIPTSVKTEKLLLEAGIKIIQHKELNQMIPVYIDSADVIDYSGQAIKGGGGAHNIEKQVASVSHSWVCIIDESKLVDNWKDRYSIPLEIIPKECEEVASQISLMGGLLVRRSGSNADSGNLLADIQGLDLAVDLKALEIKIESIPGVLACGIFAKRRADIILVGRSNGAVSTINTLRKEISY